MRQRPAQPSPGVRQRVRQRPVAHTEQKVELPEGYVADPAGYDLTDGVYWTAKGARRVLGRIHRQASKTVAYVALEDGGFIEIGEAKDFADAADKIKAKRPLWKIEDDDAPKKRKRRAKAG